jgi:hypothetical protein
MGISKTAENKNGGLNLRFSHESGVSPSAIAQ